MNATFTDWERAFRCRSDRKIRERMAEVRRCFAPIRIVQGESCRRYCLTSGAAIASHFRPSGDSVHGTGADEEWPATALPDLQWFSRTLADTPHVLLLVGERGAILDMETSQGSPQRPALSLAGIGPATAVAASLALEGDEMAVVLGLVGGGCPVHDRTALAVPLHDRSGRVMAAVELQTHVQELTQELELPEKVRLVFRDQADPDVPIYGSAHLLTYAVRNLHRNAIDAIPDGGVVGLDVETQLRTIQITVWDNGPGVAAERQRALFDESFTTKSHGSGLGLRLVRTIVEGVHGGKVSYHPNLPTGARFQMDLPGVRTPA
jgi:anti-sigma regulatory factor (Ser/Thr protein kinase)